MDSAYSLILGYAKYYTSTFSVPFILRFSVVLTHTGFTS